MRIGVIGINHKLAALALREKIAKACTYRLNIRSYHPQIAHVLLTTCNRTEIYFHAEELADAHIYLLGMMRSGVDEEFEHLIYSYFGIDCFSHLVRVVSGLDSAIIGESEIQGQVKQAYMERKSLPFELHFLFQKALKIGKQIRSQYPLRRGLPTLEETIYQIANNSLNDLKHKRILFVGISTINQKIFDCFTGKGLRDITFCNRTLAKNFHEQRLPFSQLTLWPLYDLVIFGTKSPSFLLHRAPANLEGMRLLIDLSVPRNINPQIADHPYVKLMNIDELISLMEQDLKLKLSELQWIESEIIGKESKKQLSIFKYKETRHLQSIA